MPKFEMRFVNKTLQAVVLSVFVLLSVQSAMAQQWPVGQVPVENAVPQYRPQSVPTNTPSTQPRALPLNFFNDAGPSVPPPTKPRPIELPVVTSPRSLQPAKDLQTQLPKPAMSVPRVTTPPVGPIAITPAKKIPRISPATNKAAKKKVSDKKVAKAKDKKKVKPEPQPVLNNDIYRDQSLYPIDPRKPNWPCGGGNCQQGCQCQRCLTLGNQGRPYHEKALGGCKCDSCKPNKHPNFSVHWPRPFSAKLDAHHPEAANARYAACQPKRIVDVFDGLSTFKLSNYKRTDNGYCGPGADPYGCVGESKLR